MAAINDIIKRAIQLDKQDPDGDHREHVWFERVMHGSHKLVARHDGTYYNVNDVDTLRKVCGLSGFVEWDIVPADTALTRADMEFLFDYDHDDKPLAWWAADVQDGHVWTAGVMVHVYELVGAKS